MTPEEIADYKKLKAQAEAAKARRAGGYQARKLTRSTQAAHWEKTATPAQKKALADKIASL